MKQAILAFSLLLGFATVTAPAIAPAPPVSEQRPNDKGPLPETGFDAKDLGLIEK
ncbi:MAG: hypothetical protein FWF59_07190 [Turicibacter sp.]|nr:hypothetical protein [Turicibacter sp.]